MKISTKAYGAFVRKFEQGEWPHQRFGQAFLNHFQLTCPHDLNEQAGTNHPCIFHADRKVAQGWIEANGVDWSQS